jgi:addiction module RelE/StbE family toxin
LGSRFQENLQKESKNDQELKKKFWEAVELFSTEPFNTRLRTHKLTGKLEGLLAFSVAFDCRVIFKFIDKNEVLFVDVGDHDEVY